MKPREASLPADGLTAPAADELSKLAMIAESGTCAPALSATDAATILRLIADLDKDAARYRWIRTHQYAGIIDAEDRCQPGSPCALQFDRAIDRNRRVDQ